MSTDNQKSSLKLNEFLSQYPVFSVDELNAFLCARESSNPNTRKSLLTYYRNKGRIVHLRRGLYAVVPLGSKPESFSIDPYLVAAKMTADAVLGYHTALEFLGKAYTQYSRLHYLSVVKSPPLSFQSHEIIRVPFPLSLRKKRGEMFGIDQHNRSGVSVRVTSYERTLVDVLDRPELTGSWEEIWRSLESVEYFDMDQVVAYVRLMGNATTAAKVGFFIEQHKDVLMVDDSHLNPLRKLRPRQPHYLQRNKRINCRWVREWNLMIPSDILDRTWAEIL